MAYFKEIVTKAVVGKGKKATVSKHNIKPEQKPNTVLGCWIINHRFNGTSANGEVFVNGTYDVNVWYSYDNDSKTGVANGSITSDEYMAKLSDFVSKYTNYAKGINNQAAVYAKFKATEIYYKK